MPRYWLGWVNASDDIAPGGRVPPEIKGYWQSGSDEDDLPTICALVDAVDAERAKGYIWSQWGVAKWRWCAEQDDDWEPPADRFPMPDPLKVDNVRLREALTGIAFLIEYGHNPYGERFGTTAERDAYILQQVKAALSPG